MNITKSLLLGTAAGLVALTGAQAADLPLKAKAVEYVKVCSLYGAGFYYIPGTDTCIKLGGYTRVDTSFNAGGGYEQPSWNGASGQGNRLRHYYISRSRQDLNIDTRTATEYGVVRTYFDATYNWTTGTDAPAQGQLGVYFAYIQFAGFTFGKAYSQFSTPWNSYPGNNTSFLQGGHDNVTGINQVSYTAQFGNGVSGSISLEDQNGYDQSQLFNVNSVGTNLAATQASWFAGTGPAGSSFGGTAVPDIVGKIRVDQAWGLFQVSAAAHNIRASYYTPTNEATGHPSDTWGYAVLAALSFKNLPTGAGDSINLDTTYADGAVKYVLPSAAGLSMYGGSDAAYQSVAIGATSDGVYGTGTGIEKTKAWGFRGAFNHNWNANWSSSLFGSYTTVMYSGAGKALYCGTFSAAAGIAAANCDPNFKIAQIGTRTAWTPVKNLTFSAEVMYTKLDQSNSGVTGIVAAGGTKPPLGATYEFKDQDTFTGSVRVQRVF